MELGLSKATLLDPSVERMDAHAFRHAHIPSFRHPAPGDTVWNHGHGQVP